MNHGTTGPGQSAVSSRLSLPMADPRAPESFLIVFFEHPSHKAAASHYWVVRALQGPAATCGIVPRCFSRASIPGVSVDAEGHRRIPCEGELYRSAFIPNLPISGRPTCSKTGQNQDFSKERWKSGYLLFTPHPNTAVVAQRRSRPSGNGYWSLIPENLSHVPFDPHLNYLFAMSLPIRPSDASSFFLPISCSPSHSPVSPFPYIIHALCEPEC